MIYQVKPTTSRSWIYWREIKSEVADTILSFTQLVYFLMRNMYVKWIVEYINKLSACKEQKYYHAIKKKALKQNISWFAINLNHVVRIWL